MYNLELAMEDDEYDVFYSVLTEAPPPPVGAKIIHTVEGKTSTYLVKSVEWHYPGDPHPIGVVVNVAKEGA